MSLVPGDRGVDTSGYRLTAAQLKRDGGKFRIRYSAGIGNSQPATQWKLCGYGEIRDAEAAGVDFIANSEWYESRITEGASAGRADGVADLAFWKARGLAQGASIYVSWDADPVTSKWPGVDAYLAAYNVSLAGYYHVDCYAGTPYLRHALAKGLIRYGWRPNAGSWSGDGIPYQPTVNAASVAAAAARTPAHIWQTGSYWYGKQADENVILRVPVGSHLEAQTRPKPVPAPKPVPDTPKPTPAPKPVPAQEADMYIVYVDKADAARLNVPWPGIFLVGSNGGIHITDAQSLAAFLSLGIKVASKPITIAQWRVLTGVTA